ncbi:MAG: hypothetical protein JWP12_1608 [Bacteroidetes bacterium]|nr:hypothetical protein [Bacteroidota bacterium]
MTTLAIQQIEGFKILYNSIIGFIPGGHISVELAQYRGRIQQERLNKFSVFLKEGFEKTTGKQFDPENLKTEDFTDSFETIIRKVVQTKSEEKLKRYRNVLLRQMLERGEHEMFSKFVALIDEVSDIEILILSAIMTFSKPDNFIEIIRQLENPLGDTDYHAIPRSVKQEDIVIPNSITFSRDELKFYILDLKSKGLVDSVYPLRQITYGPQRQNTPFKDENFSLSIIGKRFVKFIDEYGKDELKIEPMEYTYCIEDGQFSYEFSYPDKKCHHKVGDVFIDEYDNDVKVFEINHEEGYIVCGGSVSD